MAEITTSDVARRLGITHRQANRIVSSGELSVRKLSNGAWVVEPDSLARFEVRRKSGAGRKLSASTAWALLWELSGLDADWLPVRTRARVAGRIREADVEQLVRDVAGRTRGHRFRSANAERVVPDILATGRLAASRLDTDLIEDGRRIAGYVPAGIEVNDFARSHFMAADPNGADVLFENTLPADYSGGVMPDAVIAADLALSTDTRERSAGIEALENLKERWLATRSR